MDTPKNYTEVAGVDKRASSDPLHVADPLNERDDRKHTGNDDYVEITLDVRDNDSVTVHSVKKIGGGEVEQNSSARIRQVSEELKRLISFLNRQPVGNSDRTKFAAAHALEVLKFISKNDGGSPWAAVEKRFDEFTNETDGLLSRSLFGDCIGMKGYSKEFGELFDSLSRRRNLTGDTINKAQFKEFWDQITTQSFHSRLRTFFDIQRYYNLKVDKDAEGWIGEEEVRKIIRLSASTNRSLNFERQANELAALIMEELDPGSCGYITIENLENLLLQEPTHVVRNTSARIGQLVGHLDKTKFVIAHALEVLEFINKNHSSSSWATMEKCFDELTNETNGLLPRSMFGECIGMTKDSRELAGELFDLLSRRRNITGDSINKAQCKEFWDLIADQSFDSRLQTFFDMVDKDADTRTTEEEVTEIISLCAPTNRLDIKKKAKDYAALIMEELDPDSCGYITIETLKMLLFKEETHVVREESQNFSDDIYDSDTEEGNSSSFGLSVVRNTSARIRMVLECNHLYSASKRYLEGRLDRTSSAAAHAFMGLQFISQDHEKTKDEVMQLKVVIKVSFRNDSEKRKALKTVSSLSGTESIAMDMKERKMTITGDIDPVDVVVKLKKWYPEIVTVGPAKEEKKAEPGKM